MQLRLSDKKQRSKLEKAGVEAELGFFETSKRAIHYTFAGKDSSKPLAFFVHGSPGSSSNFLDFAKDSALLEMYQVVLIDRPGFGYSDFGKSEPSIEEQALILNEVIAQIPASKIVLIGHSLGGPIIARMAMDTAKKIHGLFIVAGSVDPELEPKEPWRKPLNSKWLRWMMPRSFRVSNQEILPAKEELQRIEPLWPNITSHLVIIQGEKDKLVPPGNADYAEKHAVNAASIKKIMLEKDNHFIPFSKPELIVEELLQFKGIEQ